MERFEGIESYSVKHLSIVKVYGDKLGLAVLVNHLRSERNGLVARGLFLGNGIGYVIW